MKLIGESGKHSFVYIISAVLQNLLYFFLLPFYTEHISAYEFGVFALLNIIITLLNILSVVPINNAFQRFYYTKTDLREKGVLLFNLNLILLIKSCFLSLVFYFTSEFLLSILFDNAIPLFYLKICTVILFFMNFSTFALVVLKMLQKSKLVLITTISSSIGSAILTIILIFEYDFGVLALIYGLVAKVVINTLMFLPIFISHSHFKLSFKIISEPLKYGYPLVLTGFSHILLQLGDRFILNTLKDEKTVGIYDIGYNIASITGTMFNRPVSDSIKPVIYQKESNIEEQIKYIKHTTTKFTIIACMLFISLSIFAEDIFKILVSSSELQEGYTIVPFIGFAILMSGLGDFLGWGLILAKKSLLFSGILILCTGINFGLNFLFVPDWGIVGAALATVIAYIIWNIFKMYYSYKFWNIIYEYARLAILLSTSIVLVVLCYLYMPDIYIVYNIIIKGVIVILYPVILYFLNFFTKEEIQIFKSFITKIANK